MKQFVVAFGSNLGNKKLYIARAVAMMSKKAGDIVALSSLYETAAWGYESAGTYLNAVALIESDLEPHAMLQVAQEVEQALGSASHRNPDGSYRDRVIDIDLIACDNLVLQSPTLTLPHPRMHLRRFVLDPLCEVAPHWMHPVLHLSATDLRDGLPM